MATMMGRQASKRDMWITAEHGGFKCSAACCDNLITVGDRILLFGDLVYCGGCGDFIRMNHSGPARRYS